MKRTFLITISALLVFTDAVVACRCSTASKAKQVLPAEGIVADGGSANDCGVSHAQCGTWSCTGSQCNTSQTACVYAPDSGPRALCVSGCCMAGFCNGAVCLDGGFASDARACDAGRYDSGTARDGGLYCPSTTQCAYGGMNLSNAVQGSARGSTPGGVFCPGVAFPVNVLTDPNNCGWCGNRCFQSRAYDGGPYAGLYCVQGFCQPL
jgi:hypothetical protein